MCTYGKPWLKQQVLALGIYVTIVPCLISLVTFSKCGYLRPGTIHCRDEHVSLAAVTGLLW